MYESIILLITVLTFFIVMIIFSVKFYNRIVYATKEYIEVKQLVGDIVSTFRKRIDKQNDKISNSIVSIERLQSSIENSSKQDNHFQDRLSNLVTSMISTLLTDKKLATCILDINKKLNDMNIRIDELKDADEVLCNTIESFKKEEKELLIKPILKLQQEQGSTFDSLTRTERQIIQILLSEGSKTSPMIMNAIGMTREHTSRLMKKLWQEGYIERDTNSMPFTYRPTKELEKRININF